MMTKTAKQKQSHPTKKVLKILGNVIFALLIVVIGFFAFFAIRSAVTGNSSDSSLLVVLSGSMEPAMPTGALVLVQPVKTENLAVNDIITFASADGDGQLVTHRIVEINNQEQLSFSTKGDANDVIDPQTVLASAVVGKVNIVIPYVGYVVNFAKTRLGLLVLVIIPGALIALWEIRKLFQYSKQLDKEKYEKIKAELKKETEEERGDAFALGKDE